MTTSYDLTFGVPFSVWLLFFLGVAALLVFVLTYRMQRSVPPYGSSGMIQPHSRL